MANEGPIALAAIVGAGYLLSRRNAAGPATPTTGAISSPTSSAGVSVPLGQSSPTNIRLGSEGVQPGQVGRLPGTAAKTDNMGTRLSPLFKTHWTDGKVGPALPVTLNVTQYVVFDNIGRAWRTTARGIDPVTRSVSWAFEPIEVQTQKISGSGYAVATAVKLGSAAERIVRTRFVGDGWGESPVGVARSVRLPWDAKPIDPVKGVSSTEYPWTQFQFWASQQRKFSQAENQRRNDCYKMWRAGASGPPRGWVAKNCPGLGDRPKEISGLDLIPYGRIGIVTSIPGIVGDAFQGLRKLF